jgi:oxygen-independent coproporphyrinogen-3 oxidase
MSSSLVTLCSHLRPQPSINSFHISANIIFLWLGLCCLFLIKIGAGAHGKITKDDKIIRTLQSKSPMDFMRNNQHKMTPVRQPSFEFMLNALRLKAGFEPNLFMQRTGLALDNIKVPLQKAFDLGLLEQKGNIRATEKGFDFLNDLQQIFL